MKRIMVLIGAVVLLVPCPVLAGSDSSPAVTASEASGDRKSAADAGSVETDRKTSSQRGHDERPGVWADARKVELEYKARMEAERRSRLERLRRGNHYHNDPFSCNTLVAVGLEVAAAYSSETSVRDGVYRERPRTENNGVSSAGIVFAPPQRGNSAAFGIGWMGSKKLGATLWLSGRLDHGDDVIEAGIPHEDYYIESRKGTYGLQATAGFGSSDAMLILGAGLSVRQTLYNAVSNVTGWKWDAGGDSRVKLAGQVGMKFQVDERVNLHFGYDTAHYAFFGLSANF